MSTEIISQKKIDDSIYQKLPTQLQEVTKEFDGREKDIVLLSSLGVLSNCFPNLTGIYDGDRVHPHLYIIIIAPAASGKGVMNYARAIIQPIHDKLFHDTKANYVKIAKAKGKNKPAGEPPKLAVKIMPANISTSEMYTYLGDTEHGSLIMESEADTMSNMLSNDWSNYSDVLRKAFQHEPISISRKMEKVFVQIKEPKLAIVISGTPDQLKPLIKSRENGLFSRLAIYNFDELSPFKNVFSRRNRNYIVAFEHLGQEIFELYSRLRELKAPIEFLLSDDQEKLFLERFKYIREFIVENNSEGFISNLHRHGLICFRIAMVLSALRNIDKLHSLKRLSCSDTDFEVAIEITDTLLRHSHFTYNTIDSGILSLQDEDILDDLSNTFNAQKAYDVGELRGVSKRTIISKLAQWQRKKVIRRVKKGEYKKL